MFLQRKPAYPRVDFEDAWRTVLLHQFHDELPGTSRAPVYADNDADYDRVQRLMKSVLNAALAEIAARLDTRGDGVPLVVYNPLAWARSEPVQLALRLSTAPKDILVRDTDGRPMPTRVMGVRQDGHYWRVDVLFLARDVPSLGYRVYRAWPVEPHPHPTGESVSVTGTRDLLAIDNGFLRVTVDRRTGLLTSILDRPGPGASLPGHELLAGPGNVLQAIAELPARSTAWVIALGDHVEELSSPEAVEIAQRGPVQATVRASYRYHDSYFTQEITLYAGVPRLDLYLEAEWYERDCCLKAAFPTSIRNGQATFEAPLGAIVRPADGAEAPALHWIDLSSSECGVSLLNDCRYAFDISGNCMRMTALRGVPDMDPEADVGHHRLHYVLYPHQGDWRQGDTVRQGWNLNMPLLARQVLRRAGVIAPWIAPGINHALPPGFAFLNVQPANIVLTALKLEQEGWGPGPPIIVRLYEAAGQSTEAQLTFAAPLMMLEETTHLEEPVASDCLSWDQDRATIRFRGHEIKTFRFRLAVPALAIDEGEEHREDIAPGFEGG